MGSTPIAAAKTLIKNFLAGKSSGGLSGLISRSQRQVRFLFPQPIYEKHLTPQLATKQRHGSDAIEDLFCKSRFFRTALVSSRLFGRVVLFLLWRSQAARHRIVNANIEGSNPSATASLQAGSQVAQGIRLLSGGLVGSNPTRPRKN